MFFKFPPSKNAFSTLFPKKAHFQKTSQKKHIFSKFVSEKLDFQNCSFR